MQNHGSFSLLKLLIREQIQSEIKPHKAFKFGPYIHFTSREDAEKIKSSGFLLKSSMIVNTVYAIEKGGIYLPEVQLTRIGRKSAGARDYACIFNTQEKPTGRSDEEVFWEIPEEEAGLPVTVIEIISRKDAVSKYLKSDIKIDVKDNFNMVEFFVSLEGEKAGYMKVEDLYDDRDKKIPETYYVDNVWINEKFRRMGIGLELYKFAIKWIWDNKDSRLVPGEWLFSQTKYYDPENYTGTSKSARGVWKKLMNSGFIDPDYYLNEAS